MVPLFGAAYSAPNKGITILYGFRPPKTMLNPLANGKIQGLFNSSECFLSTFQVKFHFQGLFFKDSPVYSSTFQACANPELYISKREIMGEKNNQEKARMVMHQSFVSTAPLPTGMGGDGDPSLFRALI